MISEHQLECRISDLEHTIVPQDVYFTTIHHGRVDMLTWVRNGGNMKSEDEILSRIDRYKEELLVFNDDRDLFYKEKIARIKELEYVLNPTE